MPQNNGYNPQAPSMQAYAPSPQYPQTPTPQPAYSPAPQAIPTPPPATVSPAPQPATGQPAMRIRQDYVPRAQQRAQRAATALCPNCGQQIPLAELDNHLRIELLDPEWKKQQAKATARSAATNLGGTDVAANLKRLRARTDGANADPMAEAASRVLAEQEEDERRKKMRMDGAGDAMAYTGGMPTVDPSRPQQPPGKDLSVQEQIRMIHARAGRSG
jgi:splicing factor 3A subunit 1